MTDVVRVIGARQKVAFSDFRARMRCLSVIFAKFVESANKSPENPI